MLPFASQALQRVLKLDPEYPALLGPIAGKHFDLYITGPLPASFRLAVTNTQIELTPIDDTTPTAEFRGTLAAFAAILAHRNLRSAGITLSGSTGAGEQLLGVMRRLHLDWEELAARFLGDNAASFLGRQLQQCQQWRTDTFNASLSTAAEYLADERQTLVRSAEAARLFDAIDELSARVDRLTARLERATAGDA